MRAIGYFRESAGGGQTLAEQNKAFLDFCAREGLEVAGTFADAASSNGHAPGFRQLVAFLRERDRDVVVVVTSIDLLGADLRNAAVRMFQLTGLGVRVTPMSGDGDAETALMAAWTTDGASGRLSDRVRAAMRRKAVKGEVLGRPPYGYKVGARRRLELVPEEAVVVRYIFRLYLHEDLGIRRIARRLNEEGLRTRRSGNWSMVTIRDILRNRAYLGTYARFNVHVTGTHPSLVSPDDFRLVQDRLNARRTSFSPRQTSQFLLSGIAHCGYCGNKLIGVSRKQSWKRQSGETISNSYRYYQCESRTNQSVCAYHTRRAEALERSVREQLEGLAAGGAGSPAPDGARDAVAETKAEAERLRSRLRSIDRRLEGYLDAAARGRIAREKMHRLSVQAAADRLAAEDALDAAARRLDDHHPAAVREKARERVMKQLLHAWDDLPFDQRQAALRDVVARVQVSDDAVAVTLRP
jgi:DNA invertase Pin-like site-specific DNA recombinase